MKLRYTRAGAFELETILGYLAERSPAGAAKVMARIDAATDMLLQYPLSGRPTSQIPLRRLPTSPYQYLIYYEVTDTEIVVHGIRHGARRPSGRLGGPR